MEGIFMRRIFMGNFYEGDFSMRRIFMRNFY